MDQPITRTTLEQALTLSVDEYTQATGIGRASVYRAIKAGEIPVIRSGPGKVRIPATFARRMLGIPESTGTHHD